MSNNNFHNTTINFSTIFYTIVAFVIVMLLTKKVLYLLFARENRGGQRVIRKDFNSGKTNATKEIFFQGRGSDPPPVNIMQQMNKVNLLRCVL